MVNLADRLERENRKRITSQKALKMLLTDLLDPLKGVKGLKKLQAVAHADADLADVAPKAKSGPKAKKDKASGGSGHPVPRAPGQLASSMTPAAASLTKEAQLRIERQAAYQETSIDLSKWTPHIHQQRRNEHLSFPLNASDRHAPNVTSASLNATFTPQTELEVSIQDILQQNDALRVNVSSDRQWSREQGDSLPEHPVSVAELRARQVELQRMRAHVLFAEQRAKKAAKIKSKSYHRIKKKERLRQAELSLAAQLADPTRAAEHAERQERERIRERMKLRHRHAAKMAHALLRRDPSNEQAKMDIIDELNRLDALKRKMDGSEEDDSEVDEEEEMGSDEDAASITHKRSKRARKNDDDEDQSGGSEEDLPDSLKSSALFNMKFMKKARSAAAKHEDGSDDDDDDAVSDSLDSESDDDEEVGDRSAARGKGSKDTRPAVGKRSFIAKDSPLQETVHDADDDVLRLKPLSKSSLSNASKTAATKHASKLEIADDSANNDAVEEDGEPLDDDEMIDLDAPSGANPWLTMRQPNAKSLQGLPTRPNPLKPAASSSSSGAKRNSAPASALKDALHHDVDGEEDEEDEMVDFGTDSSRVEEKQRLMAELFANDRDLEADFEEAKDALVQTEAPKEKDVTLPGWGSWGGPGTDHLPKRSFVVQVPGIEPMRRRDAKLKHVIINEKKQRSVEKYQVDKVPARYTSKEHFEAAQRVPLGKEWNAASVFKHNIKPRITVLPGTAIEPVKASQKFKHREDH